MKYNKYVVVHTEEWLLDKPRKEDAIPDDARLRVYTTIPDDGRFYYGFAFRHSGRGDSGWREHLIEGNKFFQLEATTLEAAIVEVRTKVEE